MVILRTFLTYLGAFSCLGWSTGADYLSLISMPYEGLGSAHCVSVKSFEANGDLQRLLERNAKQHVKASGKFPKSISLYNYRLGPSPFIGIHTFQYCMGYTYQQIRHDLHEDKVPYKQLKTPKRRSLEAASMKPVVSNQSHKKSGLPRLG